jgi:hypothetical protein
VALEIRFSGAYMKFYDKHSGKILFKSLDPWLGGNHQSDTERFSKGKSQSGFNSLDIIKNFDYPLFYSNLD